MNPKGKFRKKAEKILQKFNKGGKICVLNGWGDDPATFIGIKDLLYVRIADYYDSEYNIQITCFDPSIEDDIVNKFKKLNKKEFHCKGIHVWRHGYIKRK